MPMAINLRVNDIRIPAILNDTVAAEDLKKRLPLKISGCRLALGYWFRVPCGVFDPKEIQVGWKKGDISLFGGYLAIILDEEENVDDYRSRMVIGHINEQALHLIGALPATVKIFIESSD